MLTCVLPFSICIAALILLLIHREREHNRLTRDLIDKILIERGLEPLPSRDEPEAEMETIPKPDDAPARIRVPIPGMAAFQAMAQMRARAAGKGK